MGVMDSFMSLHMEVSGASPLDFSVERMEMLNGLQAQSRPSAPGKACQDNLPASGTQRVSGLFQ